MSKVEDRIRLFVQIVAADSAAVLLSKSLDLPGEVSAEVLAVYPERLANIVWHVAPMSQFAAAFTDSPDAVRSYLAGLVEWNDVVQGMGGSWSATLAHLRRASTLDPHFALPLEMLGTLYMTRLGGRLRYHHAVGPAHEYAQRALDIEPDRTMTLGDINAQLDFDFEAALANLEHGRRTGHPDTFIEFGLGRAHLYRGDLEEAIRRFQAALRMGARGNQGTAYSYIALAHIIRGRYASAVDAADRAIAHSSGTDPYLSIPAHWLKIIANYHAGDQHAARTALDAAWQGLGENEAVYFAGPLALLGEPGRARQILRRAEQRWAAGEALSVWTCFFGYYYLGDLDGAFRWLQRGLNERQGDLLPWLRRSSILDDLRADRRFAVAMDRLAKIESLGTPTRSVAYP